MAQQQEDEMDEAPADFTVDYETVGQNGSMLMVATSGTAVVID